MTHQRATARNFAFSPKKPAGTAIDGGGTTLHATHRNHRLRPVFMRGEAYASLKNALEVLLSRTSLDLGPRVSHHTSKHLIETQKLSPLLCFMRVYPTKTAGRESGWAGHQRGSWSVAANPVLRRSIAVLPG